MRRWRIGLPVVAVGLLLAGCGVAHERSARSVVPDTPVGLVVGSRLTLPLTTLDPDRQVLHVLNRLAYGPRPGDVERVRARAWPPGSSASSSPSAFRTSWSSVVSEPIRPFA